MNADQIRETFRYHAPTREKVRLHENVREAMTDTTLEVAALLPDSRERSTFITLMHQAQMTANAAIAIHVQVETSRDAGRRSGSTAE